jgi:hypothetical protein
VFGGGRNKLVSLSLSWAVEDALKIPKARARLQASCLSRKGLSDILTSQVILMLRAKG